MDYFDDEIKCIMPWGVLTVNLGIHLPDNQAFVDINNLDCETINSIMNLEIMKPVVDAKGKPVFRQSGFVSYPLYEFDLGKIEEAAA